MIPITDVTCIMKSYGNPNFTQAAVWALRRYYPDIRVIFADGHPGDPFNPGWLDDAPKLKNTELVWIPEASCEEVQNAAMALVETPYALLMDNDTKVIGKDALPLCLEAFEKFSRCAASGWYGLLVKDWDTRTAYVGTEFTDHMDLHATQAAFSVHDVHTYRKVGGMPKAPFWDVPQELWVNVKPTPGFGGDLTLCRRYTNHDYRIISPRATVPVLHWGQAVEWMPNAKGQTAFDQWWHANTHHIRISPLNRWQEGLNEEEKNNKTWRHIHA
jgi:hypothetical protein